MRTDRVDVAVVIPTIGTEGYVYRLLTELVRQDQFSEIYVYVNLPDDSWVGNELMKIEHDRVKLFRSPEGNIHHMWNMGVGEAAGHGHTHVVILNDDIEIGPSFLYQLIQPFTEDEDIWAVSANWDGRFFDEDYKYFPGTRKDGGLCGFAFAVSMDAFIQGLPDFDERFNIWYGDDDFYHNIAKAGKKAVMAKGALVNHINGGSQSFGDKSRYVNEANSADTEYYLMKWHNG